MSLGLIVSLRGKNSVSGFRLLRTRPHVVAGGKEDILCRGRQAGVVSICTNYRSREEKTDNSGLAHAPMGPPAESEG